MATMRLMTRPPPSSPRARRDPRATRAAGVTEMTLAPAASAALQEGVHVGALGQLDQHAVGALRACCAPARAGRAAAPTPVAQAHLGRQQARGEQLGQRAHAADAAGEDHGHAVAGHLHVGQDVGRVEHGAALALELEHEVADLLAADGIEAGHGLVEHHQLGIAHQGLRDADALEHALRELAQRPAARVVEADARDELGRALAALRAGARRTGRRPGRGTPRARGSRRSTGSRAGSRACAWPRGRAPAGRAPRRGRAVGKTRPISILSVVVLPEPLGPR